MKTIKINLYQFEELSDKAKERAISDLFEINVDHEWWDGVYEDANEVNIKIKGFDIDRGSYVNADVDGITTAQKIVDTHGKACETYKIARTFLDEYDKLVEKHSDGINTDRVAEGNEYDFDQEADELTEQFSKDITEEYLAILRKEYEYLISKESIIETIKANEYWFTEDGKLS